MEYDLALLHNGIYHEGLIRGRVRLSIEQLAHPFNLVYAERIVEGQDPFWIDSGDFVQLVVDDDELVGGYVERVISKRGVEELVYEVSGRGAGLDLVDSSVMTRPRQFSASRVDQIVRALVEPYGFGVRVVGEPGEPIRRFTVDKSDRVFDAISRACKLRGFWPRVAPGGTMLELVRVETEPELKILTNGEGVLFMERVTDWSQRFSEYHFVGGTHAADDVYGEATKISSYVVDPAVNRYRPTRIPLRGGDGPRDAGVRAMLERNKRAGDAETVRARAASWKNYAGELWRPNQLHLVRDPLLRLNDATMLVSDVDYAFDVRMPNGFVADLTLKRPEAYDYRATYPVEEREGEWR